MGRHYGRVLQETFILLSINSKITLWFFGLFFGCCFFNFLVTFVSYLERKKYNFLLQIALGHLEYSHHNIYYTIN